MKRSADQLPDHLPDNFDQAPREILIDTDAIAEFIQYAEEHGIDLTVLTRFSLKLGVLIMAMDRQGESIQEIALDTKQMKPMSLSFGVAEEQSECSRLQVENDNKASAHISFGGDHKIVLGEDLMDEIRATANSYRQEITVDQILIAIFNLSVHMLKGEESGRKEYCVSTPEGLQTINIISYLINGPSKS